MRAGLQQPYLVTGQEMHTGSYLVMGQKMQAGLKQSYLVMGQEMHTGLQQPYLVMGQKTQVCLTLFRRKRLLQATELGVATKTGIYL